MHVNSSLTVSVTCDQHIVLPYLLKNTIITKQNL